MEKFFIGGATNTTLHFETDGTMHIEEKQDCEGILDYASACRNNRFDASACDGMIRHVAEVPAVKYLEWCREAGVELFTKAANEVCLKKLRDEQFKNFRAAPIIRDPRIIMKGSR